MNTLLSEWAKLRTTRSFYWLLGVFIVLMALIGVLIGNTLPEGQGDVASITDIVKPMAFVFLLLFLAIQVSMIVTTEYRYGLQGPTFMANPRRYQVALAKLGLAWIVAALYSVLALAWPVVLVSLTSKLADSASLGEVLSSGVFGSVQWHFAVAAIGAATLFLSLGLLLRHTAGAVALGIAWATVLESLLNLIPKWGDKIFLWAPFDNLRRFALQQESSLFREHPLSLNQGGLYFAAIAVVMLVAGIVLLQRRDA